MLWAVGPERLSDVAERACAFVGTRAATAYGEHVAADLATGLVERDVAVVSGGAYGIDGAAHRAALAADGVTVAVLAGGIDVPYPAGHTAMLRRVQEQGLLVSEYAPGTRPARHRFLTRNRLVAALTGCHRGGGGGAAQRGGQHGGVGEGARPTRRCGARTGDLLGLRGMSCVAPSQMPM